MLRAALYARFSSDLQNAGSIGDQLHACRRRAEQLGVQVVAEYSDAAISGASMAGRPGLADLLAAGKAGAFDLVIAEALDRLTRSGGDAWDIFEDLKFAGVGINTISEGDVGELHIGLKGTMNALFLRELGLKVRRGLEGVVRSGRHPSIIPYGYRRKMAYDAAGERIRGLIEIDEAQAAVVRRVAAEYLAGSSGHSIAHRLNAEGVAYAQGEPWTAGAVIGRPGALRGVLRNPIYAGELVWNRQTRRKDRRTGKWKLADNPPQAWVRQAAPELAILDAATWSAVQARLDARSALALAAGNPSAGNAPKRLLSGIVRCGTCGGIMHATGAYHSYRCLARIRQGPSACANARAAPAGRVEAQVLEILRRDLLHPDVIEAFVREYHAARARNGRGAGDRRRDLAKALAEAGRRADRLVDQVAEGGLSGRAVQAKLAELEARRADLEAELAALTASAEVVAIHPQAAQRYRQLVDQLQASLAGPLAAPGDLPPAELEAARHALRQVVRSVQIHPEPGRGQWRLEVDGDLTALLGLPPLRSAAQALARQRD